MAKGHSVVIRMGAAGWTAEVNGDEYDFRKMTYDQKKTWYGAFMDGVRALYGRKTDRRPPRHRRRSQRAGR